MSTRTGLPPGLSAYRLAAQALSPFTESWLKSRVKAGKEDPARLPERFGVSALARPAGCLVWLHGASVGEMKVALQVAQALTQARPTITFLITSGTQTSAAVFARSAPANAIHQYAPLDRPDAVARFLSHWRPDIGVFTESDLWPNMVLEAHARAIPLALVNARLSPKSQANWARTRDSARRLFSAFSVVLAAEETTALTLARLSGKPAPHIGNLKLAAQPLPVDAEKLRRLQDAIGARPVWLAASTHPGEDEIMLEAHAALLKTTPAALLVLAPRHPDRGADLAALSHGAPLRSAAALPRADHPVYVADTIGEMGALFSIAPVTMMGGSLLAMLKGHNPIEPALLGSATLSGPYVESFADLYAALLEADGVRQCTDASAIAHEVASLWRDAPRRAALCQNAQRLIASGAPALTQTRDALLALLPESAHATA